MHRFLLSLASVPVLALAACGGSDGNPATPGPTGTPTPAVSPVDTPAATPEATPPAATASATPTTAVPATPTPGSAGTTPVIHMATTTPPPATVAATATPPPPANNPASAAVGVTGVRSYFWSPAKVAIAPGGSVTWAWSGEMFHDVRIDSLGYSSGNPAREGAYTVTFPAAGTYGVVCSIHPDTMRGTVLVE